MNLSAGQTGWGRRRDTGREAEGGMCEGGLNGESRNYSWYGTDYEN